MSKDHVNRGCEKYVPLPGHHPRLPATQDAIMIRRTCAKLLGLLITQVGDFGRRDAIA